jgi:hypothetical protein
MRACTSERGVDRISTDLRRVIYRVEEDVGGLEVPVDDLLLRRVQERQAARRADRDVEPPAPRQRLKCCAP